MGQCGWPHSLPAVELESSETLAWVLDVWPNPEPLWSWHLTLAILISSGA